jgi:hypothetical protein
MAQTAGLALEISCMRRVDNVLGDPSVPVGIRRRVYARLIEAYGPDLDPDGRVVADAAAAQQSAAAARVNAELFSGGKHNGAAPDDDTDKAAAPAAARK